MRHFCIIGLLALATAGRAAVPSYNQFDTNYFTTNNLIISMNSNALSGNSVKLLSPAGGSVDGTAAFLAGKPDYIGQIGLAWSGTYGSFFLGAGYSNGIGGFNHAAWYLPGGLAQSGSFASMNYNSSRTCNWYVNGNSTQAKRGNATSRNGSYFFWNNLNPWTDGSGFCVPHYSTNSGVPVLTNDDGVVIYQKNAFGNQLLTIPEEYLVGETNQAGSYVWLMQPDLPGYISVNCQMKGEADNFYSQHYWEGFDCRGSSGSGPIGVHFPKWAPYVWTFTNANNVDALYVDEYNGSIRVWTNIYMGGGILATNPGSISVFGPNWYVPTFTPFQITTNMAWAATGNTGAATFDAQGQTRLGFVAQNGQYTKLTHGSGSPLIVAQSSASDLQSGIASQTLTTDLTINKGTATFAILGTAPTWGYTNQTSDVVSNDFFQAYGNSAGVTNHLLRNVNGTLLDYWCEGTNVYSNASSKNPILAKGTATLANGSNVVLTAYAYTTNIVSLTYRSKNGILDTYGYDNSHTTNGVSFTIICGSATDTNQVDWLILQP